MNIDNQVILHIKAGHTAPDDLLNRILAKKPNAFGFCVQNKEGDKPDLAITREDGTNLDIGTLKELMENAKPFPLSLYFGNLADGYNVDDIQPFVISDGDGNPFISIMMEGTLNGHDAPADRTEQFNYTNSIIIPTIVEMCEDTDGDLEKIAKKLNGDLFNKNFLSHVGHRCVLHIIPVDGDIITIGKNDLGDIYDWGFATQTLGFGEVIQEPVVAEKPKGKFWGAKKAEAEKPVLSLPKDVATKGEGPRQSVPEVKKEDKSAPQLAARPPKWVHKNDDVKMWYKIVTGQVPGAWKKRIPGIVLNFEASQIDNLDDFNKYTLEHHLKTTGTTSQTSMPAPTAPMVDPPVAVPAAPDNLPIIGPKDLEKVLDFVAKHLDGNSKEIISPLEMQKLEATFPTFSEAVGVKTEEMLNWSPAGLFALAKTDPRSMVLFALEFRNMYRTLRNAANGGLVKTVTEKLTEGTTKVESIASPQPAKKQTGWWGAKKVA